MTNYVITSRHLRATAPGVVRWCLDFPKAQPAISLEQLQQPLLFQGWLLLESNLAARAYLRQAGQLCYMPLNVGRPDVIEKVLKQASAQHAQLNCGFAASFTATADQLVVGFEIAGQQYDFVELTIESSMKVLQGEYPWLFLDNDTNQSVAQFTGALTLCRQTLQAWQHYVSALSTLTSGIKASLLVAPTKEMVYPQYYPHQRSKTTPIQQLLSYLSEPPLLCYPAAELAMASERSFRYTDTHWTHHGAKTVSVMLAGQLGLDAQEVSARFAADQYVERSICGDLGNKLFPPRFAEESLLSNVNYKQYLCYDNGLPNFGRVMLFENSTALSPQHCLIFGASSAYSMLNYLVRIYSKVSVVHTAGNIDPAVITALQPDCLICQTNERFIVKAPVADYALDQVIAAKLAEMAAEQRQALVARSAAYNSLIGQSYFHPLLTPATF